MSEFVLKLKMKTGEVVVRGLTSIHTVSDLKEVLAKLTHIEAIRINALKGFPPKPLNLLCNGATIEAIGISSGDTLIIEELSHARVTPQENREKSSHDLSSGTVTPMGLASKILPSSSTSRSSATAKSSVESSPNFSYTPSALQSYLSASDGVLRKQLIPADNSCLFTSVGFALSGAIDTSCGKSMRTIVSDVIHKKPNLYSEAMLGRPNSQYCTWILQPESWGGGIELSILCNFFELEIAVVNLVSGNMSLFGEDMRYPKRAFLIFDGVHYDALYLEPTVVGSGPIQTLFSSTDDAILVEVEKFVQVAKANREYVDLKGFKLRCSNCQTALAGQEEALKHAALTGHQNFGEIVR